MLPRDEMGPTARRRVGGKTRAGVRNAVDASEISGDAPPYRVPHPRPSSLLRSADGPFLGFIPKTCSPFTQPSLLSFPRVAWWFETHRAKSAGLHFDMRYSTVHVNDEDDGGLAAGALLPVVCSRFPHLASEFCQSVCSAGGEWKREEPRIQEKKHPRSHSLPPRARVCSRRRLRIASSALTAPAFDPAAASLLDRPQRPPPPPPLHKTRCRSTTHRRRATSPSQR